FPSIFLIHIMSVFFFTATPTTEIYTLSLHDALPILRRMILVTITPGNRNGMEMDQENAARAGRRARHAANPGPHPGPSRHFFFFLPSGGCPGKVKAENMLRAWSCI